MTSITVIIPCYNYGRYLTACVASVLGQQACAARVLIIDDASTDDSATVARALAAQHTQVDVLVHAVNRGHIATYNEGIDRVGTDYLLILSADDLLAQGALARAITLLDANPRVAFVYGRALRFTDRPPAAPSAAECGPARIQPGADFIRMLCDDPTNPVETATAVVRTSAQRRVGGYLPELPHAGDFELWLRLAAEGDVGRIDALQAYTRLHGANMRNQYLADRMLGDFTQRHAAFRCFFDTCRDRLDAGAALESLAARRLAAEVLWAAAHTFEDGSVADMRRLCALARTIHPTVRRTRQWWTLSAKLLLGQRGWRRIEPVARRLRGGGLPATGRTT